MHDGRFSYSAGGVARNICESLFKLGRPPNFISAVGDDKPGRLLNTMIPRESAHMVRVLRGHSTAQCVIVFDQKGDCKFLMGDMQIHKQITPEEIHLHEDVIKTAPLMVLDANLSVECLRAALKLATKHSIPVLFEPTDLEISDKPFQTPYWKAIKLITPNLHELEHISNSLGCSKSPTTSSSLQQAAYLAKQVADYIENVIVTLGPLGLLIARKGLPSDPLLKYQQTNDVQIRYYPCNVIEDIINVSGAGDCLASGIIAGILNELSEERCISVAFAAAQTALQSRSAVPNEIFDKTHTSWNLKSSFQTMSL